MNSVINDKPEGLRVRELESRLRELELISIDVCAILDGWKSDPAWTEWDQSVRDRLAAYHMGPNAELSGAARRADSA